jgi:O-antigen/teichoic acid export membrane protein
LQIAVAVAFSADNFIIARTLGAAAVPEYAIPQRMFALLSMLVAMAVSPLWPAYGEAIARGDMLWVRHTLQRSLLLVFTAVGTCSALLLLLGPRLILSWVGPRIHPHFLLLLGLCIWTVIEACGQSVASFLNGASLMKFQLTISVIFGFFCLEER